MKPKRRLVGWIGAGIALAASIPLLANVVIAADHAEAPGTQADVNADIAVDDDFVTLTGSDWRLAVPRLVEGANDLLAAVDLRLKVNEVRRWQSDDAVDESEDPREAGILPLSAAPHIPLNRQL